MTSRRLFREKRRRSNARWIACACLAVVAACADSDPQPAAPASTAATTTIPVPPPVVRWESAAEMLSVANEQAVPPPDQVLSWAERENARLGATEGLRHTTDDEPVSITPFVSDGCTQAAGLSLYWTTPANAELARGRAPVGMLQVDLFTYVCEDEAAGAAYRERWAESADLGQGECPVDDREQDEFVVVCPIQPEDVRREWKTVAQASTGLAYVTAWIHYGPDTDPVEAAASTRSLVQLGIDHLAERLT